MELDHRNRTHYDALGLRRDCPQSAIRAAYRRLVLKYHPDRSKDPSTTEKFLEVSTAYEVLGNPERRKEYDRLLGIRAQLRDKKANPRTEPPKAQEEDRSRTDAPRPKPESSIAADVAQLVSVFGKGRFREAEALAKAILDRDPRQPVPYAVLADIVRARGDFHKAAKLYALAVQMDPGNPTYLKKHEEVLDAVAARPMSVYLTAQKEAGPSPAAPLVGAGMTIAACSYVALAAEPALLPGLSPISTWTLGLFVMLLLSGIAMGASLAFGDLLDRFEAQSTPPGRLSQSVALLLVAIVNFWAATALYVQSGLTQKSFSYSTSRLLASIAAVVGLASVAAMMSGRIDPLQVALWGGNVAYVGGVVGWLAADSLRS